MSHLHRLTEILDAALIEPSVAGIARRVGHMTPRTIFSFLVQSRNAAPQFQSVEWMGVTAPFHTHWENSKHLAAQAIEQGVLDRALNGTFVESRYQGAPVFELNDQFIGWSDDEMRRLDYNPERDRYLWKDGKRVRVQEWLKPSDAMTTLVLQSWARHRYGQHAQLEVQHSGLLRLERPDERVATAAAAPASFEVVDDSAAAPTARLALGRPAKDSAELDKWAAQGEFSNSAPVTFVDQDGYESQVTAGPDPLLAAAKAPENPESPHVKGHHPDDDVSDHPAEQRQAPKRPSPQPSFTDGMGIERTGYGSPPPGGYSVVR